MKIWHRAGIAAFWLTWPALWLYMRRTERTRVIIVAEGKILLIKSWLSAGHWMLPGGGVHPGESPLEAAIREVREETGLTLRASQLKTLLKPEQARDYGISFMCTVFTAELDNTAETTNQKGEITDSTWMDLNRLDSLSPYTARLVKAYQERSPW